MKNLPYTPYILDSSAVIVLLKKEPGAEIVAANIKRAIISSVNYAEVVSVLVRKLTPEQIKVMLTKLIAEVIPFDEDMAMRSGMLYQQTKKYGLSLGDRACIALAQVKGMPILTADRMWANLDLDVEVKYIR